MIELRAGRSRCLLMSFAATIVTEAKLIENAEVRLRGNDSAEIVLVSGCVLLPLHSETCRRHERRTNDSKGPEAAPGLTTVK